MGQRMPALSSELLAAFKQRPELFGVAPAQPTQQSITPPPVEAAEVEMPVASQSTRSTSQNMGGATDADMQALMEQINAKGLDSLKGENQGLQQMEQQLKTYQGLPNQVDLSPLMALADSWYGGNLQKGYTKPTSSEERIGNVMALQQALQKSRSGLSQNELQLLKDQLQNRFKVKELEATAENKKLAREQANLFRTQNDSLKGEKMDLEASKDFYARFKPSLDQTEIMAEQIAKLKGIIAQNGGKVPLNDPQFDAAAAQLSVSYNQGYAKLGALAGADLSLIQRGTGVGNSLSDLLMKRAKGQTGGDLTKTLTDMEGSLDALYQHTAKSVNLGYKGRVDPLMQQYTGAMQTRRQLGSQQASPAQAATGMTYEQKLQLAKDRGLIK